MRIVILNGHAGSGKDSFCEICHEKLRDYCGSISTIDGIKTLARAAGWLGEKTPEIRKFLCDLKEMTTKLWDYPHQQALHDLRVFERNIEIYGGDPNKAVVFIHCREPEEIARFKQELGAITLFISRDSAKEIEPSNTADANVENYDYEYYISNNGTFDELKEKAYEFLDKIFDPKFDSIFNS